MDYLHANSTFFRRLISCLIVLPLIGLILFFFDNFHLGIDITDEGYYLLNAASDAGLVAVSNFGFYTGILYKIVNGDILYFRTLGMLILIASSSFFASCINEYMNKILSISLSTTLRLTIIVVIGILSTNYYYLWLPTPSYNWLALICCLWVGGLSFKFRIIFLAHKPLTLLSVSIGLGLFISVMAKPATALMLGIFFLVFNFNGVSKGRWWIANLKIAGSILLFFALHLTFLDSGFNSFYIRLIDSIQYAQSLGAGLDLATTFKRIQSDLYRFYQSTFELYLIPLSIILIQLTINITNRVKNFSSQKSLDILNLILFCVCIGVGWHSLYQDGYWGNTRLHGQAAIGLLFLNVVLTTGITFVSKINSSQNSPISIILACLLLHLAYAFGSGRGLLVQSSGAIIFSLASLLIAISWLESSLKYKVGTIAISSMLVFTTYLILVRAVEHPYRLVASLEEQNNKVYFFNSSSPISVDNNTYSYIENLKAVAKEHEWQQGTALLDLTGGSPLANIILNGKVIKTAWISGGYPGSDDAAKLLLANIEPEVIRNAWLLTAPKGSRKLNEDLILEQFDLKMKKHWLPVGEVKTGHRNEKQILWRPRD